MSDFVDHIKATTVETDRLERELDITNADHIALWLEANVIPHDALRLCLSWLSVQIVEAHERAIAAPTCPDCGGLGYIGGEDTPSSCMNNFHKLALNESIERVAQVAKERDAFNDQMAATATYAVLADKLARYSRILAGDYHPEDKEAARFHAKDACLSNLPTIIAALRANAIEATTP